jgi:hypothetical protein
MKATNAEKGQCAYDGRRQPLVGTSSQYLWTETHHIGEYTTASTQLHVGWACEELWKPVGCLCLHGHSSGTSRHK